MTGNQKPEQPFAKKIQTTTKSEEASVGHKNGAAEGAGGGGREGTGRQDNPPFLRRIHACALFFHVYFIP